jgi:hypothetical protein
MMMPHNHLSPSTIAEAAQRMAGKADKSDAKMFQKVAMCSMIVMAAAGATQLLLQLIRELRKHDDHDHYRGR